MPMAAKTPHFSIFSEPSLSTRAPCCGPGIGICSSHGGEEHHYDVGRDHQDLNALTKFCRSFRQTNFLSKPWAESISRRIRYKYSVTQTCKQGLSSRKLHWSTHGRLRMVPIQRWPRQGQGSQIHPASQLIREVASQAMSQGNRAGKEKEIDPDLARLLWFPSIFTHWMDSIDTRIEKIHRKTGWVREICVKYVYKSCVYTYIHTYIHACMHACMHAYMHACIHTYMHTCIHAYRHTYIHAYMHTCIHAYMHTGIQAYMHTCIHAYMHTCIHAYIHTYIHTYRPGMAWHGMAWHGMACMHTYIHTYIHTCISIYLCV